MSNTNSINQSINTLDNEDYMDYQETNRDDDREDFSNEWKIGLSEEDIYHIENMNALEEDLLDYYDSLEAYDIIVSDNTPELTNSIIEGMKGNSFGLNYNKPYRTPEEQERIKAQRKENRKAKKALKQ